MINPKRLIQLANKWRKFVSNKHKRIAFKKSSETDLGSSVASKGHFIVYTTDEERFEVPLKYLGNNVFGELLRMSEEEFGIPTNGPITLPCDSSLLNYIISLIRSNVSDELQKALLTLMATCQCHSSASSSLGLEQSNQQMIICGF